MSENSMMLDSEQQQVSLATNSTSVTTSGDFNPFTPAIETPEGQVEVAMSREVQITNQNGDQVVARAVQTKFPEIYKHHVAAHGRRIIDDEETDLRLFTALSVYSSVGGNADIVNELQKITTKKEYDEFFLKRNSEVENLHHLLDKMESDSKIADKPLVNPLENEEFKKYVKLMVEQMEQTGMVEQAPKYKLDENTVDARVKKIQEMQAQGYDVTLKDASAELRDKLDIVDSSAQYKKLEAEARKIDEALALGLHTSNTSNPSDPQQAEALSQQIEGAAQIKKKFLDNLNPILRCDRTANGKKSEREYYLSPKDFADSPDVQRSGCHRLDLVLPIEPIVADQAMSAVLRDCLVTELMSYRLDTLVRPSKLYLYMTGQSHPKMVLYSDVRYFYLAMKKFYSGTNMRPTERQLSASLTAEKDKIKEQMKALGLAGVVSEKAVPDAHLENHSKERISVILNVSLEKAALEFTESVRNAILQTEPQNKKATQQCLKQIYELQRMYCVRVLNSLEIALLMYLENYIPFWARADLMTDAHEGCACCAPKDSIHFLIERRKWLSKFRNSTFIVKEQELGRYMSIDNLLVPYNNQTDRIDPSRDWTPTWKEMLAFVQYFTLNIPQIKSGEVCEDSQKAHRWVTKYIAEMQPAV